MNIRIFRFALSVGLLCAACACRADDDAALRALAEIPAEVVANPTGELARGRPYQGTPSSVVSASGKRLFVAWYGDGGDEGPDNYVMVAYCDGALGGGDVVRLVVRSPHVGKVRCFDPAVWREPSTGRVWISWCQTAGGHIGKPFFKKWNRYGATWAIYTDNPDDVNPVWSAPRRLFDGVMLNKPLFAKSGDVFYPVVVFQMRGVNDAQSLNEGLWVYRSRVGESAPKRLNGLHVAAHGLETMMVEKRDGTLWFLARVEPYIKYIKFDRTARAFRRVGTVTDGIYEAFSEDGGRTFSELKPSPIPHVGSRFHLSRLKSGNLLLVKNYANDERWLAGLPKADTVAQGCDAEIVNNPRFRKRLTAYLSRDDGKTWEGGLVLDARRGCAYPDASQADDGLIYITWDFDRYHRADIRAARVSEADILAGKIVAADAVGGRTVNRGGKAPEK